MTLQSPRIYTYKIKFEEVPYYYYGVHKEKKFDEYYMGTSITHKWAWELYTPKKQILELFEYSDEGWLKAQEVEKRLIKPFYNTDKWCLNENCGGKISLKVLRECGKKVKELGLGVHGRTKEQMSEDGKKVKELGVGIFGRTKEQVCEDSKKGGKISGKKAKELGLGIHGRTKEQMSEDSRKSGKKAKELGVGVHGMTKEQLSENGKKGGKIGGKIGGKKVKELGVGIFGRTKEQVCEDSKKGGSKGAKKTNAQKWMCIETRYVSTSAGISHYQKARGIDTSKRIKIS